MPCQRVDQEVRDDEQPAAGSTLRLGHDPHLDVDLLEGRGYMQASAQKIEIGAPQTDELAPATAEVSGRQHKRAVVLADRFRQPPYLVGGEESLLLAFETGQLDSPAGEWGRRPASTAALITEEKSLFERQWRKGKIR
jgi:hypothetical protein